MDYKDCIYRQNVLPDIAHHAAAEFKLRALPNTSKYGEVEDLYNRRR